MCTLRALHPHSPAYFKYTAAVRAARTAAVSGALSLASSYLDQATGLWPYHQRDAWIADPEVTFDLLTITAEVALGSKTASRHVANVSSLLR